MLESMPGSSLLFALSAIYIRSATLSVVVCGDSCLELDPAGSSISGVGHMTPKSLISSCSNLASATPQPSCMEVVDELVTHRFT
jgi:hypothetical protein